MSATIFNDASAINFIVDIKKSKQFHPEILHFGYIVDILKFVSPCVLSAFCAVEYDAEFEDDVAMYFNYDGL